ncbi:hypothetical protein BWZ20_09695 [Winogradskyella sp. J14-2]|nr:hypothetical protein BWZ20_09695 [Winogradskyella sp. J14-2]
MIFGLGFSQNLDSLQLTKFQKEIDTIEYSSGDFKKLKQHINSNSKALKLIFENAAKGSKSHIELLEFLKLSFDEAKIKYGVKNLKSLIFSYYKSNEIVEKFKKLDSSFQAQNKILKLEQDSISKKVEFSDEIKKSLKIIRNEQIV